MKRSYLLIALLGVLSLGCGESVQSMQLPCSGDECPPCVEQCDAKGTMLYYCDLNGQQEVMLCPGGCQHGVCYGPEEFCTDGDARCIDDQVLLICTAGKWVYTPCDIGMCVDGVCMIPLPPCEEGTSECLDPITRQYCRNAELHTEKCDYLCQNGQCIPEPSSICSPREAYCLDDVNLHYCEGGSWIDMQCEYRCQDGECISEDENYICPSGANSCKDIGHGFRCMGHGWATVPCLGGCIGATCLDETRKCTGASECVDSEYYLKCVDGYYQETHCPPGFACIDEVCEDANKPFYDPRATNPVCDPVEDDFQYRACNALFDVGICVDTTTPTKYYCIGGCDPDDPKPYICENYSPYNRAFSGVCQIISNGQYAFIPYERYLCKNSCTPEEGCDEIIEVDGGHYRDDCTNIPNECDGTKVHYCHGRDFTYDCEEVFGQGWTCAVDQGDVLCAEPCTKEGEQIELCMNMPVTNKGTPTLYTKTCKRFDDDKLYYRNIYGEICDGNCHPAGTRCIPKAMHPVCNDLHNILENCTKTNPNRCPQNQVCVTDGENTWCGRYVSEKIEKQTYCATNDVTHKTIYQDNRNCYVERENASGLAVVRIEYTEYCATSECDDNSGCFYVE